MKIPLGRSAWTPFFTVDELGDSQIDLLHDAPAHAACFQNPESQEFRGQRSMSST